MSEEQLSALIAKLNEDSALQEKLSALIAKLNEDSALQEKLKGAADLDAAVAMARESGFDVSKDDWLRHQTTQKLSDDEVDGIAGGYHGQGRVCVNNTGYYVVG